MTKSTKSNFNGKVVDNSAWKTTDANSTPVKTKGYGLNVLPGADEDFAETEILLKLKL